MGCNNYEIVDLGVMVPPEKILETAKNENVDIIGLSGLITPSLDEMEYVAEEMQRQDFNIPLLIGGATTSKAHTAVKIDPKYENAVVHVNDASRAVTVVGDLLNKKSNLKYVSDIKSDYNVFRDKFNSRKKQKAYISIQEARKKKYHIDWETTEITTPNTLGVQVLEQLSLKELLPFIDWTPFFISWDLHGKYPNILEDNLVGQEATKLFEDAQSMINQIISKKLLKPRAVFGIFEANSVNDDDIKVRLNKRDLVLFRTLRQQLQKRPGKSNYALADFIAPESSGITDYIGSFCVSIFGASELVSSYKAENDDYNAIMVQAIADRFAEAFAEYLHHKN